MAKPSKRNLRKILEECPTVNQGQRGVMAGISAVRNYMDDHELIWAPRDQISQHVAESIGCSTETRNYHAGSRGSCAYYTRDEITGGPEYREAMDAMPTGARLARGLIVTIPSRGMRQEWEFSSSRKKWVKRRLFRVVNGRWEYGRARRIGRYRLQRCRGADKREVTYIEEFSGALASKSGKRIVRSARHLGFDTAKQLAAFRRNSVKDDSRAKVRGSDLQRFCPDGWDVVCTSPSEGQEKRFAFREIATGEEYHIQREHQPRNSTRIRFSSVVNTARSSFAQRAKTKEDARLLALIDRGGADDVFVCFRDSLAGGNCKLGTNAYADSHDLDKAKHYLAKELVMNGNATQVKFAIAAAVRRTRREKSQGFCVLEDHIRG